jgi:hypothetical protein
MLHGRGQGAVLAVAASRYAPDSVVGLALDEMIPARIAGWEESVLRPSGVPLLQVGDDAPRWLHGLASEDTGVAHGR